MLKNSLQKVHKSKAQAEVPGMLSVLDSKPNKVLWDQLVLIARVRE